MPTIPDFQSIMLPLLVQLTDGQEHVQDELEQALAGQFQLTQEQLLERLDSGKQTRFGNRVSWVLVYLSKAGLIERTGRKRVRLTDRGRQTLVNKPTRIDTKYLRQFPEFLEFQATTRLTSTPTESISPVSALTPSEQIAESYRTIRTSLASELLDRVKQASPAFFEGLVVDLLVAMGYGGSVADAGRVVGRSGDGGIDGIIKEDRLGLDFVYIQAKRWEGTIGRPIVQAFAGSLEGHRANKGVMITTSAFTSDARDFVRMLQKRIVLIDGVQLAGYMIDHGVGVSIAETFVIKKIDFDYFDGR